MNTIRKNQGFTLVELLLYVSVIGGLLIALSMFFATTVEARIKTQSIMEVDQQGALAMDYMLQTIRNADSVTSPTPPNNSNTLTLVVPTGSLSPTIFDTSGSNALQVKEGVAAAIPLTNNKVAISGLSFTNLTRSGTPGVVRVSFTISRVNTAGRNPYEYQKTFTSTAALRRP